MTTPKNTIDCRLRPFRPGDIPLLVRLDRVCFPPPIAYDRLEMLYHVTAPRHLTLLAIPPADETDRLLGFVIAAAGPAGREGQIVTIDVDPESRQQGIGRLLLEAAEKWLIDKRNNRVHLQVALDNHPARTFYRRAGYHELGLRPGYYGDGSDAMEMIKRVSGQEKRRSGE